ncbi:IclR family transcriptional regulator [Diaphorobacter sp. HDW4A]|uniref:IclR family transcriptional regulator n=1 Tax=Diaphorobacter sp. HDW4A TaxID=2714924 RepID=UPI001407469B|nr:IclR family transcriptional regulator [Diaphorobacter sp. HDW4A]QIL79789.1 IclR family transcriptional regulator [Diaphorobacter sp. HDW4A]
MPADVPACARTLAVLEVFAREKRELSVSDVARFLDLADSSCSDLLHTMLKAGYVMRTAKTRRFYPTSKLYSIALDISRNDPLYMATLEMVELLSDKTGESAFCAMLEDGAAKVLATAEGRHHLRYVLRPGERIALHASALGKAVLGSLDDEEMRRQLRLKPMRKVTSETIVDPMELEDNVKGQRERGWYSVQEEGNEGVLAFGIPLQIGNVTVALSIAGPLERMRKNQEAYLAEMRLAAGASLNDKPA